MAKGHVLKQINGCLTFLYSSTFSFQKKIRRTFALNQYYIKLQGGFHLHHFRWQLSPENILQCILRIFGSRGIFTSYHRNFRYFRIIPTVDRI